MKVHFLTLWHINEGTFVDFKAYINEGTFSDVVAHINEGTFSHVEAQIFCYILSK